ncbi:MAG: hypothetical protein L0Z62_46205 [Gemmataceae bacterium]|nr:hypothetical protein [Gemmataceae bacterium]
MRTIRVSSGWLALVAGCLLLATVGLLLALSVRPAGDVADEPGRILTAAEMRRAFGDAPGDACKKTFACNVAFREGPGGPQCVYYHTSSTRIYCCPHTSGQCYYTGGQTCLFGTAPAKRMVAANTSATGSCNTCTGTNFTDQGTASGLKDGASTTSCP